MVGQKLCDTNLTNSGLDKSRSSKFTNFANVLEVKNLIYTPTETGARIIGESGEHEQSGSGAKRTRAGSLGGVRRGGRN